MSDTSLVFNTVGRDRGVSALLTRTASQVRAANLASAASTVVMGGAMASAAAHGIALAAAVTGAAGAVWLMPGAVAATTATVLAGTAVTMGLGEAWDATGRAATTGGSAATAAARRVTAAQREHRSAVQALADAQRAAQAAQEAVTRARADEVERLEDLSRAAADARLDEEDAVDAVSDAERELAEARSSGNLERIDDAERAYRRAEQTLANVRDRVSDLAREQEHAGRVGVDGSDQVQAALDRQAEAQRQVDQAAQRVADALDAVREASTSAAAAIDPATEALNRLSPAGRAVITTLRDLQPAWEGAARVGQQRTFAGVAGDLRDLSGLYLPGVTSWLGRMGGAFNTAIRQSLGLAQTRDTVRDVDLILDNTATSSDRLAAAVRPIVNGFLQFAAVGSGFLPGMAGDVGTLATRFEQWAIASRQSGDAQRWMSTGLTVLRQLGEVAWNVVASVRAVVGAGDNGGSTLDFLVQGSAAMRAWLESAEGQQRVGEVLTTLRSILTGVGEVLPVIAGHADTFNDGLNVTGEVVSFAAGHLDTLAKILPIVAAGWVISRSAQTAANIASVIALPIRLAEVAANWGMRSALNAHTAALTANTTGKRGATVATAASTAATTAGDAATKRSVWSINALSGAMLRARAAMVVATVQQWALNIAQMASPTTWIVLGILALIAVIVLIATKTQWFQQAWDWAWSGIKRGAEAVGDWFVHTLWEDWILGAWNGITNAGSRALDWYLSLPGKLLRGLAKVGDILAAPFKAGFNMIASWWNRSVGQLSFTTPSWVPGIGGMGWAMPQLPMLARGGYLPHGGAAIVGDGGEPEVVDFPAGARVTPLSQVGAAGGTTVLEIHSGGTRLDDLLVEILRRAIRSRGGKVQVVLGTSR